VTVTVRRGSSRKSVASMGCTASNEQIKQQVDARIEKGEDLTSTYVQVCIIKVVKATSTVATR
jgi:hypothetical protein